MCCVNVYRANCQGQCVWSPMEMLVDSDSVTNLISEATFQELKHLGLTAVLEDCPQRLYAYGGQELHVIGQIKVEITIPSAKTTAKLVVINKGRCLLGYSTASELGILHIGAAECNICTDTGELIGRQDLQRHDQS